MGLPFCRVGANLTWKWNLPRGSSPLSLRLLTLTVLLSIGSTSLRPSRGPLMKLRGLRVEAEALSFSRWIYQQSNWSHLLTVRCSTPWVVRISFSKKYKMDKERRTHPTEYNKTPQAMLTHSVITSKNRVSLGKLKQNHILPVFSLPLKLNRSNKKKFQLSSFECQSS